VSTEPTRDSAETRTPILRLYLIRHGETAWSLTGQHTGRTDIPLTAHGEDEARELRPWLSHIRFSHALTSPLQRARRTRSLAVTEPAADIEPDLVEWDYGAYEGQCSADVRKGRPGWSVFRDGCPGGEVPSQISLRADRLITRLRALDGNVALFSHGEFGCALAARWIGLHVVEGQHLSLSTAALGILSYNPVHPEIPMIALWNAAPTISALH